MDLLHEAKRPATALAGPYGHPLHPALVAVPIGAWVASLVFDVASHVVTDPGFLARGSTWLIAIGVLGALAAAMAGFLDLFAIPPGTPAFRLGLTHMGLNAVVIIAYAVDFWLRLQAGRGAAGAGAVGVGLIALSAAALAVLAVSGYLGGKLAYRYGVRVAAETTQAEGFRTSRPPSAPRDAAGTRERKEGS